jgi:hypothetical protein
VLHLGFQFGADAQLVVDDHGLQVVQAAFEVVAPGAGALQAVGRAHVEHQEAVDVADQRFAVQVAGQQFGMARLHAAVAAHVEVPALSVAMMPTSLPCASAHSRVQPETPNLILCGARRPL